MGCTLPYASPELIRGLLGLTNSTEHIDTIAQDLWSVACLLYEMLTCHQLFGAGCQPYQMAAEIQNLHNEMVGCPSSDAWAATLIALLQRTCSPPHHGLLASHHAHCSVAA